MMLWFRPRKFRGGCYATTGAFVQADFGPGTAVLLSGFWCGITGVSAMSGGGDLEELD